MKRTFLFLILIFLSSICLYAEEPLRISVLDFETSNVSQQEMYLFTDYISAQIGKDTQYILIDRRQRENILDEVAFSQSGCTDEDCQLEIGRLLSANTIIGGSLGSIGSTYLLNMYLVNVHTGETLQTISEKYGSLEDLVDNSDILIRELLGIDDMEHDMITGDVPVQPEPQADLKSDHPRVPGLIMQEISRRPGQYIYYFDDIRFNSWSWKLATELVTYLPDNIQANNIIVDIKPLRDKYVRNIVIGILFEVPVVLGIIGIISGMAYQNELVLYSSAIAEAVGLAGFIPAILLADKKEKILQQNLIDLARMYQQAYPDSGIIESEGDKEMNPQTWTSW